MTAMEHFRWKLITANPLHTLVFGVTQHQTIEQGKMALVLGRLFQFQGFEESIYLRHNVYKKYNVYNSILNKK
jgi:hypothetical protein